MRAEVVAGGLARAGLGAGLLATHGMAAWMRGWRACAPPVSGPAPAAGRLRPPERTEVVGVLASMALACAAGR